MYTIHTNSFNKSFYLGEKVEIKKATYGDVDVTEILKYQIEKFNFVKASNDIFGDTKVGHFKYLIIHTDKEQIIIPEDESFKINVDNSDKTIGIVVVCTNAYFILGIRFVKKFNHYYKGKFNIKFYLFSNLDPTPYLPNANIHYIKDNHDHWWEGTNSKFKNIIKLENEDCDFIYYFDADTNIDRNFDESWFLGELVGGELYGNRSWLSNGKGFDRNKIGKSYVPLDSKLKYTYYYGAFFGGKKEKVINFCKILREYQIEDKKINYEPPVNDESYINAYFHFNPPEKTIPSEEFKFLISDKGGIGETRDTKLNMDNILIEMLENKHKVYDIQHGLLKVIT